MFLYLNVTFTTIKSRDSLENINWRKCIRYSLYGMFVSSPLLYIWVRISSKIWKKQSLATGIQKALVEQVTYGPVAVSAFFFLMAYADNNYNVDIAKQELQRKFWDSFKVCISMYVSELI